MGKSRARPSHPIEAAPWIVQRPLKLNKHWLERTLDDALADLELDSSDAHNLPM